MDVLFMDNLNPRRKALIVCSFFAIIGLFGYFFISGKNSDSVPLAIFYALLVLNTYFSIKIFARVTPSSSIYKAFDASLVVLYSVSALSMHRSLMFVYVMLILFIVATGRYAFMIGATVHRRLIKRKIIADLSGAMACALTLGGILFGYSSASVWGLALVFAAANALLFFKWPLYLLDEHTA